VELYTDGTDQVSQVNQNLELSKFHTVAIPFYAILMRTKRWWRRSRARPATPKNTCIRAGAGGGRGQGAGIGVFTALDVGRSILRVQWQGGGGELLGHLVRAMH